MTTPNPVSGAVRTGEDARRFFQERYYDNVDRQDAEGAVSALHEAVEFDQVQVWQTTDLRLGANQLRGRDEVLRFLSGAKLRLAEARIRHRVDTAVLDGFRGALRAHVVGEDGEQAPFIVWFELEDGLVRRYLVRPV
jgi:hypothetical protein